MKQSLEEDKLACKIKTETGCSWDEAFERASIELYGEYIWF